MSFLNAPYNRFQKETSTQDLLKALALFTMIIDHLGMIFFPTYSLFRVIGRSAFIIWLFFVGFNYKKTFFTIDLVFCALLMSISNFGLNSKILPLNILFSVIICRAALKYYSHYIASALNSYTWFFLALTCFFLYLLTNCFFEYGTLGILIAIWGYNFKHKIGDLKIQTYSVLLVSAVCQIYSFNFNFIYSILCFFVLCLTSYALFNFKHNILNFKGVKRIIINISARYSLYLYCLHLLLFLSIRAKI